jgi:hypothetical protein
MIAVINLLGNRGDWRSTVTGFERVRAGARDARSLAQGMMEGLSPIAAPTCGEEPPSLLCVTAVCADNAPDEMTKMTMLCDASTQTPVIRGDAADLEGIPPSDVGDPIRRDRQAFSQTGGFKAIESDAEDWRRGGYG